MRSGDKSFKCPKGSGLPKRVPGASRGGRPPKPPVVQVEIGAKNCLVTAIALAGGTLAIVAGISYGVYAAVTAVI